MASYGAPKTGLFNTLLHEEHVQVAVVLLEPGLTQGCARGHSDVAALLLPRRRHASAGAEQRSGEELQFTVDLLDVRHHPVAQSGVLQKASVLGRFHAVSAQQREQGGEEDDLEEAAPQPWHH